MTIYSYNDISYLKDKVIVVIGYGSQGRSQALNLKDSGLNVMVALHNKSSSIVMAKQEGFEVIDVTLARKFGDVIVWLAPDELHQQIYDNMESCTDRKSTFIFAHGFSVHYKLLNIDKGINVCLVSPKAVGPALRDKFISKEKVACFISVHQDPMGDTEVIANSYAAAITSGEMLIKTSFREETEANLFSEQVVLCGGLPMLIKTSFEVLIEAGFSPEIAYWGCLHESKLITDLLYKGGLSYLYDMVSNTAEFGGYNIGGEIINDSVKNSMKKVLENIKKGHFFQNFIREHTSNFQSLLQQRKKIRDHPLERVGKRLRDLLK